MIINDEKSTWRLGSKYGIELMNVGEEKTVPYATDRVRSAICMYVKRNGVGWKFITAVEKEGKKIGTRIKRVK